MVLSFSLKIGEAKASINFNDNKKIENESISDLKLNSSPKNPIRIKSTSKIIIDTVVDGNLNSNINKNIVCVLKSFFKKNLEKHSARLLLRRGREI